ncbi:MAG: hypothetical protein RLZZ413_3725, partial [Pseudomonadota bacterium]
MAGPDSRRPLGSRDTAWARALARRLAAGRLTPNQISMAGMGFAGLAGLAFCGAGQAEGALRGLLLVAAALGCQARLVCNLMDGMVAVEGGKRSADGAFWNEFPDRVSDTLILIGVGYGFGLPALGWAAAAFAVLTAYVRALGRANGLPAPQRLGHRQHRRAGQHRHALRFGHRPAEIGGQAIGTAQRAHIGRQH